MTNLWKGIAIAGIWIGVGIAGTNGDVSGVAFFAMIVTFFIAIFG